MGILDNLAYHLQAYKDDHRLSLDELSSKLGVGRTTLYNCLHKKCNPCLNTVDLIANQLGISAEALLSPPERVPMPQAMPVKEVLYFARENISFPRCPNCHLTMEREYVRFCDRCGQKLDWSNFRDVSIISIG